MFTACPFSVKKKIKNLEVLIAVMYDQFNFKLLLDSRYFPNLVLCLLFSFHNLVTEISDNINTWPSSDNIDLIV